jgi:hypothetical protein
MRIFRLSLLLLLGCLVGVGHAGGLHEMELKDGSVISGEILSMDGDTYTIRTQSLGDLKIRESEIKAIRVESPPGGEEDPGPTHSRGPEFQAVLRMLMKDSEVMDMIGGLQADPDFQKVLEDPDIMKAVERGDTSALMRDPKFRALLEHPKVKAIRDKIED